MTNKWSPNNFSRLEYLRSSQYWGLYRAFLAIALIRNMESAGVSMGISVATLKRRLDRLEVLHGTKLYNRYGGNISLTREGNFIFSKLKTADALLAKIFNKKVSKVKRHTDTIKLGIDRGLVRLVLFPFFDAYPEYARKFSFDSNLLTEATAISKNNADVVLSMIKNPSLVFEELKITDLEFCFIATANYIKNRGKPSVDNLQDHTLVLTTRTVFFEEIWLQLLKFERESKNSLRVPDVVEGSQLVRANLGYGMASFLLLQPSDVVLEDFPRLVTPLWLSVNKKLLADPDKARLINDLVAFSRQFFNRP